MNKPWIHLISAILLCGTLILCTSIYVKSQSHPSEALTAFSQSSSSPLAVLNLDEAAEYLRITPEALKKIIQLDDAKRQASGPSNAYELIPYVSLNGQLVFYRPALDKWLDFNSLNH